MARNTGQAIAWANGGVAVRVRAGIVRTGRGEAGRTTAADAGASPRGAWSCSARLRAAAAAPLPELRAEDLRMALRVIGQVTGQVGVEDVLG